MTHEDLKQFLESDPKLKEALEATGISVEDMLENVNEDVGPLVLGFFQTLSTEEEKERVYQVLAEIVGYGQGSTPSPPSNLAPAPAPLVGTYC